MNREEALNDWLPIIRQMVKGTEVYEEALDMAIKSLKQEPCDDAVSKDAVLDLVADYDLSMGQVVKGIHALPPVTPQPKMGRWEKHDVRGQRVDCCSVCGLSNGTIYEYNYCPNCGAKMENEI